MTKRLGFLGALALSAALLLAIPASAMADRAWRVDSLSNTTAQPGSTLDYLVQITNTGNENMTGDPIELVADLPDGVTANSAVFTDDTRQSYDCFDARDGVSPLAGASSIVCRNTTPLASAANSDGRPIQVLTLTVDVPSNAAGTLLATFTVSGGGGGTARTVDPTTVAATPPEFGIDALDAQVTANAAGDEFTQAGGHPYAATVSIDFNTITNPAPIAGPLWPVEPVKSVFVDVPAGLVGDPTGVDQCTGSQLANSQGFGALPLCPPTSQVGTTLVRVNAFENLPNAYGPFPVFNLVPPPNVPARFGFNVLGSVVVLDAEVRSGGDYGITVKAKNVPEALAVAGTTVTLWGVPSDASHDVERACPGRNAPSAGGPSCASGAARTAFLRNPTSCPEPGVGLATTARVDSWTDPGDFKELTSISHLPPGYPLPPAALGTEIGTTNCAAVPFDPRFTAAPVVSKTGVPTSFQFDLSIPQTDDADVIGQADLRRAQVTLPMGVRVSPSSAHGLGACSPAEIDLKSGDAPSCPDSSKIGSAVIDTPVLEDSLRGAVYLARQRDNPFGSLLSIYLVAEGPGVVVKLAGKVDADPLSGQLTATFNDNPQLPFSNLHLEFKGGPTAALVTPKQCGTYTTRATFTSWSGKTVQVDSPFTINQGCEPRGFAPKLSGGLANPIAGSQSPFVLRLTREDTDQEISSLDVTTPQGLAAVLKGVPVGSQVGTVVVGAGAGTNPFYIETGKAFLGGPYKGAPLSLLVSVPAIAGPFDLGVVEVRAAVHVDPVTAQITVRSDPLPTILEGIPLDVRDIRVSMNRPDFMVSPTSCDQMSVDASLLSTQGTSATASQRFQLAECSRLGFKPKLTFSLRGGTKRTAHPALTAILKPRRGDANISRVSVALPKSEFLDQAHIVTICTRAQFAASSCPRGAIYGRATVTTPLFDEPLTGPVYLRSSKNLLPDLVPDLRGPDNLPIRIEAAGRIDEVGGGIRNTFDFVPDAPFTKLVMRLKGGNKGLLQNSRNICRQAFRATVKMDAHNGKIHDTRPVMKADCGRKSKRG